MTDPVLGAFVAAWEAGDPAGMAAQLDPDAVLLCDTGGRVDGPSDPVNGAEGISRWMLARFAPGIHRLRPTRANTRPAVLVELDGRLVGTLVARPDGDHLTMLWLTLNPEKLRPDLRGAQL